MHPNGPDPVELVVELGGVVRTERLRAHGIARRSLEQAVASGQLIRIRRGWVAAQGAEPILVAAARTSVVVSCVTQAARLGLWVHGEPEKFHVAAKPKGTSVSTGRVHVHWSMPLVPRHPDVLVDPIENVLALVADCEPFERALATWESALNQHLVTLPGLVEYDWKPAACAILAEADPFADAGTETYLRSRLKWLRLRILSQIWIAGHRVDTLIGERLVLQIDGKHHVGAQRSQDIRHDAELRLMGYHVIRVSYQQLMHDWPMVQDLIMRSVALGLHLAA
ncbi:type IV toxin-antitoxin system AbiEi family antitoxin domain-containing protein [Microbacterium sp. A196]|uniref:type IV toxin-antitoxin system AbiEi family antitoxin domain-containing protein n=1 Tax=Microbacterium sp. A196 TaxID=3457320 RepID=UPI003FD2AADD